MLTTLLYSQTSDDFEDGNFTANPAWTGTQNLFIVNSDYQLQLNDVEGNTAYLSTTTSIIDNTEWRIWVKLNFSPSANNNARFYIVSDNENPELPLNGYFLQFGEAGSDDAIELFRQDGIELTSVCRGNDGAISSSFETGVKITRTDGGLWKLYVDENGGIDYQLQSEGTDNTYTTTSFIDISCKYTSSNSSKMYFDNVYAGSIIIDNDPPILLSAIADSDTTISLVFNEYLNEESVAIVSNYSVNMSIGNPVNAYRDDEDGTIAHLTFSQKFTSGNNYTISVSGVKDLAENIMEPTQKEFIYYQPQPYDVVINEIMADPSPTVGLPDYEYLELYNTTSSPIDLDGWKLFIGSTEKEFDHKTIEPDSFLIVAKEIAFPELYQYGSFYGFSSFSLTNSGQTLELISKQGITISMITYSNIWYNNPEKEDGGWSIEQKNAKNVCSGSENWSASINPEGGTPGSTNSIANNMILLPEVKQITIADENILHITFNQNMNEESILNQLAYTVNGDIGNPKYVYTMVDEPQKAELYFENKFHTGLTYELTISKTIMNCMQLAMYADTIINFGIPETVMWNDIVINELLFNPWTNGEDYIEIYNRSAKICDLSELVIGSIKISPPNPPDTSYYNIVDDQFLFIPKTYMVLSISPDAVKDQYFTSNLNGFIRMEKMPSLNNDNGFIFIQNKQNITLDSLHYSEDMQFPMLNYFDGVALERINPDAASNDNNNWHSAAESVGFGTPAYQNSQYVSTIDIVSDEITIAPEIFSPDNDGYDDVINIKYKFDKPGYIMSVEIYNSNGYPIRKLINNEYLGTEGSISWDGINDNNSKAPTGIYIFYITVYDTDGNVKKHKKTGVLAVKL